MEINPPPLNQLSRSARQKTRGVDYLPHIIALVPTLFLYPAAETSRWILTHANLPRDITDCIRPRPPWQLGSGLPMPLRVTFDFLHPTHASQTKDPDSAKIDPNSSFLLYLPSSICRRVFSSRKLTWPVAGNDVLRMILRGKLPF